MRVSTIVPFVILLLPLITGSAAIARGSSAASHNNEGNKLYTQGRYQDAEKAYVDAQLAAPGKPEVLYNMGNALLKQKKYQDALQALRQAISRGSHGLQGNGWYNLGNALFEMGNYKDAADSFVQALRINPADRDAKHNLEMALNKLQEQKKAAQGGGRDRQEKQEAGQQQQQQQQRQQEQKSAPGQAKKEEEQPARNQAARTGQREEGLGKERALQILDALQNQELAEQRKLMERQARQKAVGKDW